MEDLRGHVRIHVKLMDHKFYKDSEYVHLWVHILMKSLKNDRNVNFRNSVYELSRGQFISSISILGDETNIEKSKVQRILTSFREEEMIDWIVPPNREGAIFTVKNYDSYQEKEVFVDENTILTEEQVSVIITSWQKVQIEAFQINNRYAVSMTINQRKKLEGRTFKQVKLFLETFGILLTDVLKCELIVREEKKVISELEIERVWNDLIARDAQVTEYVREHIGKDFVNRVRESNSYGIDMLRKDFGKHWREIKGA